MLPRRLYSPCPQGLPPSPGDLPFSRESLLLHATCRCEAYTYADIEKSDAEVTTVDAGTCILSAYPPDGTEAYAYMSGESHL